MRSKKPRWGGRNRRSDEGGAEGKGEFKSDGRDGWARGGFGLGGGARRGLAMLLAPGKRVDALDRRVHDAAASTFHTSWPPMILNSKCGRDKTRPMSSPGPDRLTCQIRPPQKRRRSLASPTPAVGGSGNDERESNKLDGYDSVVQAPALPLRISSGPYFVPQRGVIVHHDG